MGSKKVGKHTWYMHFLFEKKKKKQKKEEEIHPKAMWLEVNR